MKKLSLMIAAFALAGVACGDSDSKKADGDAGMDGGGNGGGNGGNTVVIPGDDAGGGNDNPFPMCDEEAAATELGMAGMPWGSKPKPWTMSELTACTEKCTDGTLQCFIDMCDGQDFVDCFTGELGACTTDAENAPCRDEFLTIACCAQANETCYDDFEACIGAGGACGDYLMPYQTCGQNRGCQMKAVQACVGPDVAAPDAGPDADAGTPKSRAGSLTRIQRALSTLRIVSAR